MTAGLPAPLTPWAAALAVLAPELADALGPLVRRLDTLVGAREPIADAMGTPDGFGGLARTGRPDQLLPSEWLLAEEFPDEFLRRHAERELLYAAPELRAATTRGRVVALVDAGPAQAGAGRLVQLAALLVLHSRATARGTELLVGVLGDPPGRLLDGSIAQLLPRWLSARRSVDPTPEDVRSAEEALDEGDRAWLLTSRRLGDLLPARGRVVTSEETGWGPDGAARVTIRLDGGAGAELPLPTGRIAVRALRGAAFRQPTTVAAPLPASGGALPAFTTDSTTLLARGHQSSVLLAVRLSPRMVHMVGSVRPRRHELPGQVVAAGRTGRRLLALYAQYDRLSLYVSGREIHERRQYNVELGDLGLDRPALADLANHPVLPLLRDGDDLLVPVAGHWRRIAPGGRVTIDGPVVSTRGGEPFLRAREPRLFGGEIPPGVEECEHLVHGAGILAWSEDGHGWDIRMPAGERRFLELPDGGDVIAVAEENGAPVLITCTRSARLVRSVRQGLVRTLTSFSGGVAPPAVHPIWPMIAAEPRPGRLKTGNALTGKVLLAIRSSE
ncbi:hypothetical protein KV557_18815 [Kitasatospora aureofaciens]|uniref:hypothetical protein n=1 Tax=Kitasatospora aureofaciens TaxID=1894 RepID=UPI001C43AEB6|nr:hypothetical protein [Kitasatospora aureofaciens]MBV6699146.1 hypothetical protein [Kitasatospora aureofaciens]